MADVETFMSVSAGDIEKIMGVAVGDIEAVVGLGVVTGPGWLGSRHIGAGWSLSPYHDIEYKASTGGGDTLAFGDLDYGRSAPRGAGTGINGSRGIIGGGHDGSVPKQEYDYLACSTLGSAADAGDMTNVRYEGGASSNGTLLFFMGGVQADPYGRTKETDYITIATLGTSTNAGELRVEASDQGFAPGDTRGASFGGYTNRADPNQQYAAVDYIVFHTSNDAADFGDMSLKSAYHSVAASTTRWVLKSGSSYDTSAGTVRLNHMDWWTVSSGGTHADFGDIAGRTDYHIGMSDGTRGEYWGGRNDSGSFIDSIAYITIANATDADDAGNIRLGAKYSVGGGFSGAS